MHIDIPVAVSEDNIDQCTTPHQSCKTDGARSAKHGALRGLAISFFVERLNFSPETPFTPLYCNLSC